MSAAAPLPSHSSNDAPGGYNERPGSNSNSYGGDKPFAHIQDLQRKALEGFNSNGSVHQLLIDADKALSQAQTLLNFRRGDLSYVEYLRAAEIVVEVIPHNKGWPDLQMDHHGGGLQKYQLLQKKINGLSEQYANIKSIIINNNRRSGVQPTGQVNGGHTRTGSTSQVNGTTINGAAAGEKIRPSPSPKPEYLHGRAISHATVGYNGSTTADPLGDRFARLRMAGPLETDRPGSRESNHSSVHSSPTSRPDLSNGAARSSLDFSRVSSNQSSRPIGPRAMPPGNNGPPLPGKLPLDTNFAAALPKEPSPTYSPARNMQAQGNVQLPRHSARSLASTSGRRTSLQPTSSASSHAPNGCYASESNDYFPSTASSITNGVPPSQPPRRKSVNVPKETRISPERLYDYLERFNVLIIDFRTRENFDQGHIYARSVMCIEPIQLSQGMSAEQLQDRMVVSPDIEQEMFTRREEYDLVVYYDEHTQSESYLHRPSTDHQTRLKYLHEALHDFNQEKPLRHPPILLIGGIDAWTNMIGNQALMSSNTASRVKQGRPIARRPALVNGTSQLRNPKRRLRDYNPLDDDEEQKWRERARAESVVLPTPTGMTDEEGRINEEGDELGDSGSAIQEFLERFPEAGSLDRHAFGPLHPTRTPPEPPPKVPMYPPRPPSASLPSAPARPAPAAPRPSYTGVSDRAGAQNPPFVRSTSMVPYVPPKYLSTVIRLPKTGLYNFRYTCYMNATLQALSATTALSIYFLEDTFRNALQKENWKGTKGVLPELYSNVVRSLWKGDVNFIRPTTFRNFCGRLKSEWGRDDQEQDAKEFFDFLIDCLHEDLNPMWHKKPLRQLTDAEEANREKMPKAYVARIEWGRFTHRDLSFITSLFGGQYSSRLQCLKCGHTSTTYDAFYSLSVEIPRIRGRNPTLHDCLESYCTQEKLEGSDQVRCDRCKEFRDSTKQITITRAPQILVVHFKRFHSSGRSSQKIHTPIDFPLEDLDLGVHMMKQPSHEEVQRIEQLCSSNPEAPPADASMTPPFTYDAYAVVRHLGHTLEQGHYTALVKDRARRTWRCFNDRVGTDFTPGQGEYRGQGDLRNGQAYIVFYQRQMPSQTMPGGKI